MIHPANMLVYKTTNQPTPALPPVHYIPLCQFRKLQVRGWTTKLPSSK